MTTARGHAGTNESLSPDSELTLIVLQTEKLEAMREFFGRIGIHFVGEKHEEGPFHYSATIGSLIVELYPLPNAGLGKPDRTRLGFRVSDLRERLKFLDPGEVVTSIRRTDWGSCASVRDPDGRIVLLYER